MDGTQQLQQGGGRGDACDSAGGLAMALAAEAARMDETQQLQKGNGRGDAYAGAKRRLRLAEDDRPDEPVETDPTSRFQRFDEVLGAGSFKTVYRAFDQVQGVEVAWNRLRVSDLTQTRSERRRLLQEIELLASLNHKNIVKAYLPAFECEKTGTINFISEIFTSGTLRQYRYKHRQISAKGIKSWLRQILHGLVYLHGKGIIHRDLKLDNIFIDGQHGAVKIGDLGLATLLHARTASNTPCGTPEYMAPEMYDEHYTTKADIWSFGMCVLELETFEVPWSECQSHLQIFRRVMAGQKPAALQKVKCPVMREFIGRCLLSEHQRPTAAELLLSDYLTLPEEEKGGNSPPLAPLHRVESLQLLPTPPAPLAQELRLPAAAEKVTDHVALGLVGLTEVEAGLHHSPPVPEVPPVSEGQTHRFHRKRPDRRRTMMEETLPAIDGGPERPPGQGGAAQAKAEAHLRRVSSVPANMEILGVACAGDDEPETYDLTLKVSHGNPEHVYQVNFEYDRTKDTPDSVANEMRDALGLSRSERDTVCHSVVHEINGLESPSRAAGGGCMPLTVPGSPWGAWRPGPSSDGDGGASSAPSGTASLLGYTPRTPPASPRLPPLGAGEEDGPAGGGV